VSAAPALPVTVAPRDGESIESWLEHLADANGLTTAALLAALRRRGVSTRYLTLAPGPDTIRALADLARVSEHDVHATTLAAYDGTALDLAGLDPDDRHSYRQVAARGWTPAHGTQACPACLAETGTWRSAWRLLIVTTCTRHASLLVTQCPACQRPLRDQRHSHLRAVGAANLCGNPLGAGPTRQCQHDLTTITSHPADTAVMATQERVDAALAGAHITTLGVQSQPATYLKDLRHLTTLLLHLGRQAGADKLAPWVPLLTASTSDRGDQRSPRWGLRPPTTAGLRAQTLTTADAMLAASDLDAAVEAFQPWVELTPNTPDGVLGWLADRTVMTPTLTRLVMAARAPQRRLSHHLDNQEGDRMNIDTRGIPQVIPAKLYDQHLADASSASEATVRLFASLCLARQSPDVTSWAKAADILGMPSNMGINCARACSATMLVDNTVWTRRLDAVWEGLTDPYSSTGRWNYRAYEAKAHRRWSSYRWFEEWAKEVRPNTRRESRGYALTWQWIHRVHGHIDTSPAWAGKRPTATQRAHYRSFDTSLDERQQERLGSSVQRCT
jgi:hypothetical protein